MTTLTAEVLPVSGRLGPGARVEVRRRFDRAWARGFVVARVDDEGYRLRRTSDGALLPIPFPPEEIRPAGSG